MTDVDLFRFLRFEPIPREDFLADSWDVMNHKNEYLGAIRWYRLWKQFCFFPAENLTMSAGCLVEVASFLKTQNDDKSLWDAKRKERV